MPKNKTIQNKPPQKRYLLEILFMVIEMCMKGIIVPILYFMYGKNRINYIKFITFVFLASFIAITLSIKHGVYDERKITKNILLSTHVQDKSKPKEKLTSPYKITFLILCCQLLYIIGVAIAPKYYKTKNIHYGIYIAIFVGFALITITPLPFFKRKEHLRQIEYCKKIQPNNNTHIDKKHKTHLYSILIIAIDIATKAAILPLDFIYATSRINFTTFFISSTLLKLIGAIFFVTRTIKDRETISLHIDEITNNDHNTSTKTKWPLIVGMCLLQVTYIIGSATAQIFYKQDKLTSLQYATISTAAFFICIIPMSVYSRITKVNNHFKLEQVSNLEQTTATIQQ